MVVIIIYMMQGESNNVFKKKAQPKIDETIFAAFKKHVVGLNNISNQKHPIPPYMILYQLSGLMMLIK
jgi:hypothetical protein